MEMPSPRRETCPNRPHGQRPLTEEVQRTLRVKLIRDTVADMVARLYAVSRRTLYRHLKAEGGTFRQVANEVRCEIACTLLAETDIRSGRLLKS